MLAQIPDILIRLRTQRSAWTTDISKLYNRLFLQDSALPYSPYLHSRTQEFPGCGCGGWE